MPRRSRIDAPGALHHIIGRGIGRRKIFLDDTDRNRFLERLGDILTETGTACYAWALIPNHFHLLLRSGGTPMPTVIQRLLSGYANSFNRRHRRHGHLFQNRYKSILCQEEPYLLELVRYIHLNPLRAGLVHDYGELCRYPYCGQSVILGKRERGWHDAAFVLQLFHKRSVTARRLYRQYVEQGIEQGRRPELVGGGLLRSYGGWAGVKALRRAGAYRKGDERILGEGDFVERVLAEAEEGFERRYRLAVKGFNLERAVNRVAEVLAMPAEEVLDSGKARRSVVARNLLSYWATKELGITQSELAKRLGLTQSAISLAAKRGAALIRRHGYSLERENDR